MSSIFVGAVFANHLLQVEFTTDGDIILHDPAGELDMEAEFAAYELGFEPPAWLSQFLRKAKMPVWFLMYRGELAGPALKLWCLAVAEKGFEESGGAVWEPLDELLKQAREAALLPPPAAARAVEPVTREIVTKLLRWASPGVERRQLRMLKDATNFWEDYADPEFTYDELHNLYIAMLERLGDLGLLAVADGSPSERSPKATELRKWMLGEAVRQIKDQAALFKV